MQRSAKRQNCTQTKFPAPFSIDLFGRQRVKVLSLAIMTLCLSISYNPRYITEPAKSKTDSWANVYQDERTFSFAKFPHPDSNIGLIVAYCRVSDALNKIIQ